VAKVDRCWAAPLDDCEGALTKEHTVSKSVLADELIEFTGPRTGNQPKRIGVNSLSSKILCERHNNALSPLDEAAAHMRTVFDACQALGVARLAAGRVRSWSVREFDVDGPRVERWFLKTFINHYLTNSDDTERWPTGLPEVPESMVRVALGAEPWPERMGMCTITPPGIQRFARTTQITTHLGGDGRIACGIFSFHGIGVLLALRPMPDMAIRMPFFESDGSLPYFERPRLRPVRIRFYAHEYSAPRFPWTRS